MKPRVLFVGRTRYRLPLPAGLARKFDALESELDYRVLACAQPGSPTSSERFALLPSLRPRALDGFAFYLRVPFEVRRAIGSFRPHAVIAETPHTGALALLARRLARGERPCVIVEVHGDWRTATRLYGSPLRRALSPLADALAALALRRADAVRALSPFTQRLVEEVRGGPAAASFTTYTDLAAFTARPPMPLPERPSALFVGVLERYKNVDGLAAAWRIAAPRLPGVVLRIVGEGGLADLVAALVAELPGQTVWTPSLAPPEVAEALDGATVLLLPSRSEGTPRVVIEAFCRGRPVIGARAGGIPDLVQEGANGLLVDLADPGVLAEAIVRVLSDRELAERLAAGARASAKPWVYTAEEYAASVRALVDGAA